MMLDTQFGLNWVDMDVILMGRNGNVAKEELKTGHCTFHCCTTDSLESHLHIRCYMRWCTHIHTPPWPLLPHLCSPSIFVHVWVHMRANEQALIHADTQALEEDKNQCIDNGVTM